MGIYAEAIILYIILFFSGIGGSAGLIANGGVESFSVTTELFRIFLYYIPSLALIWYLLLKTRKLKEWDLRLGSKDLLVLLITLPCLLITGFIVTFVSSYIGETPVQITLYSPSTAPEWVVLCIFCICAAYLEESFFRFYLLSKRNELKLNTSSALVLSVALFSICHIYEGPWGFLNSVISGIFLAFMFLRYNSLHGITIAHSLYNIAAYVINAVIF
jgi:membrane protease YdiL (CAAX protease family)